MNQSLQTLNLPQCALENLHSQGIYNVQDVPDSSAPDNWNEILKAPRTQTALEMYVEEQSCSDNMIPTDYNRELNLLLRQEMATPGSIVEISGHPGSGKTQLCYYVSAFALLHFEKNCETLFIGTNRNFSRGRFRGVTENLINHWGRSNVTCDVDNACERAWYLEALDFEEFYVYLNCLDDWLLKKNGNIKLLVIDSIAYALRQADSSLEKGALYIEIIQKLRYLGHKYNFSMTHNNPNEIEAFLKAESISESDAVHPRFLEAQDENAIRQYEIEHHYFCEQCRLFFAPTFVGLKTHFSRDMVQHRPCGSCFYCHGVVFEYKFNNQTRLYHNCRDHAKTIQNNENR